jgi:hypothetical protein
VCPAIPAIKSISGHKMRETRDFMDFKFNRDISPEAGLKLTFQRTISDHIEREKH